eukprot:gb/GECG01015164.1/.p1 GENE.gb/GECG01015164.1/~~gb/GECG01015164.1/.p1  ORF type:complete len:106 (+),score=21.89 gb/GECG01015164.1/:1-318(+)
MSGTKEETKPDVSQETGGNNNTQSETISFRVKDNNGDETTFKVKKTTKMSKVLEAFATRKGMSKDAIRFMLDGTRVDGNETPASLDLEENDQIDCQLEQQGGDHQ